MSGSRRTVDDGLSEFSVASVGNIDSKFVEQSKSNWEHATFSSDIIGRLGSDGAAIAMLL
jgi:hypothetical protein